MSRALGTKSATARDRLAGTPARKCAPHATSFSSEKESKREREREREREENNKFDGNSFPVRATPAAIRLPRVARAGGQITRRERMEGANFHRPAKSARFSTSSTFAFGGIISVRDSERLSVARAKYILISVTFPALIGRWSFPG